MKTRKNGKTLKRKKMEREKTVTTFQAGIGLRWAIVLPQGSDLITPKE